MKMEKAGEDTGARNQVTLAELAGRSAVFLEAIMEARGNIKLGRCEGVKGMLIGKKDLDAGSRGSFRKTVVVIGSEHYCCAAGGNLGCCVLSLEVLNL